MLVKSETEKTQLQVSSTIYRTVISRTMNYKYHFHDACVVSPVYGGHIGSGFGVKSRPRNLFHLQGVGSMRMPADELREGELHPADIVPLHIRDKNSL